jgi:hypothetical protein
MSGRHDVNLTSTSCAVLRGRYAFESLGGVMPLSSRTLMMALVLVGTPACVDMVEQNLRDMSVGQTGCPEADLSVTDVHGDIVRTLWIATCHGHRFLCSQVGRAYGCHEALSAAPPS